MRWGMDQQCAYTVGTVFGWLVLAATAAFGLGVVIGSWLTERALKRASADNLWRDNIGPVTTSRIIPPQGGSETAPPMKGRPVNQNPKATIKPTVIRE